MNQDAEARLIEAYQVKERLYRKWSKREDWDAKERQEYWEMAMLYEMRARQAAGYRL